MREKKPQTMSFSRVLSIIPQLTDQSSIRLEIKGRSYVTANGKFMKFTSLFFQSFLFKGLEIM